MSVCVNASMDHSKCRDKVCVVCSKKASRLVSKTEIDAIKTHVDGTYHLDWPEFPRGICTNCHIALNKKKNGQNVELLINQTYKKIRFLRSSDGKNCPCSICETPKSYGASCANLKRKRGRPTKTPPTQHRTTVKVCSLCFQEIYPGCRHQCSATNYRRKKVYNVEELLTPTTSERVASRVINRCKDDSVLSTLGCRKKSIASEPNKKRLFTTDDMRVIGESADLSLRQTISIMEDLNKAGGHTVFETGAKRQMCEKNHSLDSHFNRMKIQFVRNVAGSKKTENFYQHVVVNDIPTLIDQVLEVRSLDRTKCLVKVGMDGGGEFFKICLSIFNLMMRDEESKDVCGLGKNLLIRE